MQPVMPPKRIQSSPPFWGLNIRAERVRRNLNQQELAELVGLSPFQVHAIETGRTPPRITTLLQIAHALDVPLDALLRSEQAAA